MDDEGNEALGDGAMVRSVRGYKIISYDWNPMGHLATPGLLPVFVHNVLLEHSYLYLLIHFYDRFHATTAELSSC